MLAERHQTEAFVLRGLLGRVPVDPADPDHQPREEGLVEDLRGHADVVDDGLASPRPGAERVVTEDTHDRSCSGSSSPLSRRSRRASPNPFWRMSGDRSPTDRSEEHTSELQSLMRISYAVFCLKKKKKTNSRRVSRYIIY